MKTVKRYKVGQQTIRMTEEDTRFWGGSFDTQFEALILPLLELKNIGTIIVEIKESSSSARNIAILADGCRDLNQKLEGKGYTITHNVGLDREWPYNSLGERTVVEKVSFHISKQGNILEEEKEEVAPE